MDFQNDGEFIGGCIAGGRNYFHINANVYVKNEMYEALLKLLEEKTFSAISVSDITTEANVSKSYYVKGGFSHLIHMTAAYLW